MEQQMIQQFRKARETATPLIAIQTPDPAASVAAIKAQCKQLLDEKLLEQMPPLIQWNVCDGWTELNKEGAESMRIALDNRDPQSATLNPVEQLMFAKGLTEYSILFVHNAHRYLTRDDPPSAAFAQAVWNLRDIFKTDGRSLVLLGPSFTFPSEIAQDVLVLDEPLPDDVQLTQIINDIYEAAESTDKATPPMIDAMRGLAPFPAESVVSQALELKDGKAVVNMDTLWERKRKMIEQNRGLTVWREGQRFADTRGLDGAVEFFREYITGEEPPNLIVFIDELDKSSIVGGIGDSSGTSSGQLGVVLTEMQDNRWTGSILYGHPGTGKTLLAKTIGNEAGVPTIYMDLEAMQDKLVGESGRYTREAFKVIKAVGGSRVLFMATCNEYAPIKPELKRRFGLPTFFFDLLSDEARLAAWRMFLKRYNFDEKIAGTIPDAGWTGAEIERCVHLAFQMRTTPDRTARYIIPIAQSSRDDIARRRREAENNLLDAATGQAFQQAIAVSSQKPTRRLGLSKTGNGQS